jgi:low affinity Fe/Cu permease
MYSLKKEFMKTQYSKPQPRFLERLSAHVTEATGSNAGFVASVSIVIIWAALGPLFNFSDTWKWIISISTSMITFLMVFLLQKSQNKESLAIQLKLNELLAAHEQASNRLVNAEEMTEDEMKVIRKYYSKLSEFAVAENTLQRSHSIDGKHELDHIKNDLDNELKR